MKVKFSKEQKMIGMYATVVLVFILLFIQVVHFVIKWDFVRNSDATNCLISLVMMLFVLTLFIAITARQYNADKQLILFVATIVSVYLLLYSNSMAAGYSGHIESIIPLKIFSLLSYFFGESFWLFAWAYLESVFFENESRIYSYICYACGAIYITFIISNLWRPCFYYFDANALLHYIEPDYVSILVLSLTFLLFTIRIFSKKRPVRIQLTLLSFWIFPIIYVVIAVISYGTVQFTQYDFSSGVVYTLFIYMAFFNVSQTRRMELYRIEKELDETKLNSLMLQINPHFIYNTLGSIASLCESAPDKAVSLVQDFSAYLRGNYSNMTSNNMIPFREELKHLRSYIAIEQVRFPNVEIEYDIQEDEFLLPCLSVQPIVENAIKHGVRKRRHGAGKVTIASFDAGNSYVVRVSDNGVGFTDTPINDGKSHVGIQNVTRRLKLMCDGTLIISSFPGEGTVAEITIPKDATKGGPK